jgi:hypothetical protein
MASTRPTLHTASGADDAAGGTRGWSLIDFSAAGVFAFFFCAAACAVLVSTFSMFRAHAFTLFGAIFVHTALQWPTQALDKWLGRWNHPCCGARSKWRSPGVRESDTPAMRTHSAIRREHAAQQVNISLKPSGPFALCLFMPFAAALYRYEPDQLLADGLVLLIVLLFFVVLLIVLLLFSWVEEWICGNRNGLRVAKFAVVLLTLVGAVVLGFTLGAAVVQELVEAQGGVRSWVAESVNNNNDTVALLVGKVEGTARGYVADYVAKLQVWAAPLVPLSAELGCMHAALSANVTTVAGASVTAANANAAATTANATNTTWPKEEMDGKWGGGEEEPTPVTSSSPGYTCRVFRLDGSDPKSNLFALIDDGRNTDWFEMASQGRELINWGKATAAGQDIARWGHAIFSFVLGLLASGGGVLMELVIFASFLSALPSYSKGSLVEIMTNALLPASEQTRERVADRLQGIVTNIFLLPLRRAAHRLPLAWAMFTACEEGGFPLRHCCALLCVLVGSMQVVNDFVVLLALVLPWWWFGGGEWERLVQLVVFGGLYLKFVYDLDAMLLKELADVEKEKNTRGLDLENEKKKEEERSAAYIQSLAVVLGISQFGFRGMFIGPMLCSCVQLLYAETGEYFKNNKPAPLCGGSLRERQPASQQTGGGGGGDSGGGGAQVLAEDEDERKESGAGQPHRRNTRQEKKKKKTNGR